MHCSWQIFPNNELVATGELPKSAKAQEARQSVESELGNNAILRGKCTFDVREVSTEEQNDALCLVRLINRMFQGSDIMTMRDMEQRKELWPLLALHFGIPVQLPEI
eukprot:CAMPEP_0194533372 /NCGR_PEP_ID=MMETSP0253-20130528/71240_1 /TAXON_ID=2966 /ORGANISM="Noctiluca scintillans" /LENGTH=106 /DNA_ID=CAMNT_0039378915 /DNA_START=48 /DNA_END=365 /DNA_ORIENTATION=+